ncbi:MAG TPA: YbhB/YbcL family Raf kinase inhibitor-like protein [Steroidobacteraceae bacterium]|nr:YbhB/YbcL family Raf kinase inhibitor-like protein [Steroidobacteraceae bacterium]
MLRRDSIIGWRAGLMLVLAAAAASAVASAERSGRTAPALHQAAVTSRLTLRSPDVAAGAGIALSHVYDRSGCHGGNVSPALSWSGAPAGTRSFTVLMFDPDAPGEGWWHWALFDIPPGVTSLQAGAGDPARHLLPAGAIQVRNDFGSLGYGGPCPPPGKPHHYRLMLYALRVSRLGLDASASPAQVAATARASAIAEAELVAPYGR